MKDKEKECKGKGCTKEPVFFGYCCEHARYAIAEKCGKRVNVT